MKIRFRIRPFARDIRDTELRARGAAIAQQQADLAVEQVWQRRVRQNEHRRGIRLEQAR
jgi:primosomal protein N''